MGRDMSERGIVWLDEPGGIPDLHRSESRAPSDRAKRALAPEVAGTRGTTLRGVCPVDVDTRAGIRIRADMSNVDSRLGAHGEDDGFSRNFRNSYWFVT